MSLTAQAQEKMYLPLEFIRFESVQFSDQEIEDMVERTNSKLRDLNIRD